MIGGALDNLFLDDSSEVGDPSGVAYPGFE